MENPHVLSLYNGNLKPFSLYKIGRAEWFLQASPLGTWAGGVCRILVTSGLLNSDDRVEAGGPGLSSQFRSPTSGEQVWL